MMLRSQGYRLFLDETMTYEAGFDTGMIQDVQIVFEKRRDTTAASG